MFAGRIDCLEDGVGETLQEAGREGRTNETNDMVCSGVGKDRK